jgi:hypothetical protein
VGIGLLTRAFAFSWACTSRQSDSRHDFSPFYRVKLLLAACAGDRGIKHGAGLEGIQHFRGRLVGATGQFIDNAVLDPPNQALEQWIALEAFISVITAG